MKPMEKDTESIGTVQMKTDYAHSEVYSTASEPPPVYMKRQSNSIKIAKIAAFTVILSSFLIGAFILGSTYLQARATCSQMQILDNIIEKEMNYEQKQNGFKAEALLGNAEHLNAEKSEDNDIKEKSPESGNDEVDTHHQVVIKMPLQMNPSDMVNAFMAHNDKSRMNCVVERRLTEEQVDEPSQTLNLPLGLNVVTRPKKGQITGERMYINCDSGKSDEERDDSEDDVKPVIIPIGRLNFIPPHMRPNPIPYGDLPRFNPLTHMPQRMPPQMPQMPQMPFMMRHPDMMNHHEMMNQEQHQMLPVPPTHEVPPPPPPQSLIQQILSQRQNQQPENQENMPRIHIQIRRIPISDIMNDNKPEGEIIRNVLNDLSNDNENKSTNQEQGLNGEHTSEEESEEFPRIFNVLRSMMNLPISDMAKEMEEEHNKMMHNENENEKPEQMQDEKQNEKPEEESSQDSEMLPPMGIFRFPMSPQLQMGPQSRILYGRSLSQPIHIPVPMDQEQADLKSTVLSPAGEKSVAEKEPTM